MKILLIDDEPDILHHMKKALQILGHNCDAFEDPLAALAHFNGDHYDLIISDVVMPGMNGFSVAAEVRRIDPATKIILSSGHLTDAMEDTTGDNTSLIYLKKPVDIHRLKTVLDNIRITAGVKKGSDDLRNQGLGEDDGVPCEEPRSTYIGGKL